MGAFIDQLFYNFDYFFLELFHKLAVVFGGFLTPLCKFMAITGNLPFLIIAYIAIILLFIPKYRKQGVIMLVSIVLGAIITSVMIKPLVMRTRPYQSDVLEFKQWWEFVGCSIEKDSSFPSGHTCVAASGSIALLLSSKRKKQTALILMYPFFMACSRIYLCVHYPSDTLFGLIVGMFAAFVSYYLVSHIYRRYNFT